MQSMTSNLGIIKKINDDGTVVVLMSSGLEKTVTYGGFRQVGIGDAGLINSDVFM